MNRIRYSIHQAASLAVLLFATSALADVPVTINWSDQKQEIDGFGAATGFNKAGSIYRIPDPAVRSQVLDLIFSRDKGIGLSVVRLITGDGGKNNSNWGSLYDGPTDTIWPTQAGGYQWDAPTWNVDTGPGHANPIVTTGTGAPYSSKANFDFYQVWIAHEAMARNPDVVFSTTPWSPPYWMKTNNSIWGANDGAASSGKLKPANYQDYANYLAEYVLGYQREFGIPISVVSVQNEPTQASSYSGCVYVGSDIQTFIKNNLGPTFVSRNIPAKIMAPEAVNFTETSLETATLNDPAAEPYLSIVSTHAYGLNFLLDSVATNFPVTLAKQNARPANNPLHFWETEFMSIDASQNNISENCLTGDGLKFSQIMSDMINNSPSLNSYHHWWAIANNGADGSDLGRLCNDGRAQGSAAAGFTGTETGEYRLFKRYYTFGHLSRFVLPGYVRIGVSPYRPADGVRVSAFKDPDTGTFVIVALNQGLSDQTLALNLSGFPAAGSVVPYVTSDSQNQQKMSDIPIVGGVLTATLKLGSIATFVSKDGELPDLNASLDTFSVLEAESAELSPGLTVENLPGGGAAVTGIRDGSSLLFRNVNFADGSISGDATLRYICSLQAKVASTAGGTLEARVDSVNGPLVGTISIPAAFQGWARLSTLVDTTPAKAYGHRDLYLVFSSGGGALCYLDAIRFDQGRLAPAPDAELVVNPGAEIVTPLTWAAQGAGTGGTVARSTVQAHSGAASVLLSGTHTATRGISQSMTNKMEARYTYDLSAWVRPAAGADTIKAQLLISRQGMVGLTYDLLSVAAPAGQWTQISGTVSVPVPYSMLTPNGSTGFPGGLTLNFASATANGSFYLDDVSVKLTSAAAQVIDTTAPVINWLVASPNSLGIANNQMVNVTVTANTSDSADPAPSSMIISVVSSQPATDGADIVITGPMTVQLRAKTQPGTARVYTITVKTTDASGNWTTGTVNVSASPLPGRPR